VNIRKGTKRKGSDDDGYVKYSQAGYKQTSAEAARLAHRGRPLRDEVV
jgi:hypothetical protein